MAVNTEAYLPQKSMEVSDALSQLRKIAENPKGLNLTGFVDDLTSRYFSPSDEALQALSDHPADALRLDSALLAFDKAIRSDNFPMERVKESQAVGHWLQALGIVLGH